MAVPYQVQNLGAQQADGNILLTWDAVLNATGYFVARSPDGVNYTQIATLGQVVQYLDPYPGVGVQYTYLIEAFGVEGLAAQVSLPASAIAAPPGEMSLYELRERSKQTADRLDSQFVTDPEWNAFIRLAMYELYDLLITTFDDYGIASPVYINTNGSLFQYALPDGTNYKGGTFGGSSGDPSPAFYKLSGLDLGVNTSNNAWVTLHRFDWIERNAYVYPNSTSTIYGVYNMRYKVMGRNLILIPTPAGNQQIRMWYAPILPALLKDTDLTTIGYSGWLRYPIVRAAKYVLDKEESSAAHLSEELLFLKQRIEQSAASRDQGQAETISNTRRDPVFGGGGWMDGGANGGF